MHSFPTDPDCVRVEHLNDHFTKFHLRHGLVLHRFTAAHDAHFHSHPFNMWSDVLSVGYVEEVLLPDGHGGWRVERLERQPETSHHIAYGTIHRLVGFLDPEAAECWTATHPYGVHQPWHFYRLTEDGQLERREPSAGPDEWEVMQSSAE